ncbi:hypothetical protein [Gimesia maris]|uniref:hypothetical protein n=1 Tax=Gimesia maris TaxID=122 RepID=UPI003A924BE6
MDDAEARQFAADVFAETDTIESVVVVSEITRNKSSPSTARRRLDRLLQHTRELVAQGQHCEARHLVQSTEWTGPQMLWWCDDCDALGPVLRDIYGILKQKKQRGGYDVSLMDDRVALMMIWHDR